MDPFRERGQREGSGTSRRPLTRAFLRISYIHPTQTMSQSTSGSVFLVWYAFIVIVSGIVLRLQGGGRRPQATAHQAGPGKLSYQLLMWGLFTRRRWIYEPQEARNLETFTHRRMDVVQGHWAAKLLGAQDKSTLNISLY